MSAEPTSDLRRTGPIGLRPADDQPWIETRAGGMFFVNALLATPLVVVLVPLLLGGLLRALGVVDGPSRVFDTLPMVADHFVPRLGWLAAPAAWFAWRALRITDRTGPRLALFAFLSGHVAVVGYTLVRWFGG